MHLIRFPGLTPDLRAQLPAAVGTFLLPTAQAMDRIEYEAQKQAQRRG